MEAAEVSIFHDLFWTILSTIKRSNKKMGEKNMSSKKLAGKVAVITGGNSGIGLATAQLFHAEGAKVAIMGRDQKSIDTALKTLSTDSLGFAGDVSSLKDLETFMAKVNERFGRIDTLFVNAGVTSNGPTPVATASEHEFDRVFGINTKGAFFTVQKALPYMPKGSTIVFCTSIVDRLAIATAGVYSASKAAVRSFTKVIASEMLEKDIRVNAVSPGPIKTPIIGRRADEKAVRQTWDYLASVIPMKRMGEAEEVAKAVLFLSSDDSSFTTGTELQVDGGSVDLNLFEGNKYERRE